VDLPHRQTQLNFTQDLGSHKVDGAKTVTSSAEDRTLKQEKKWLSLAIYKEFQRTKVCLIRNPYAKTRMQSYEDNSESTWEPDTKVVDILRINMHLDI
jgi:hypothetical protein